MMEVLRRVDDGLAWLEDVFLAATMVLLAVVLFINVLLRYVFRSPFAWLEEGVIALFVWIVFVGVSAAFRSHQHLRIDVLIRFLPRRLSLVAGVIQVLVMYAMLALLVVLGYDYAAFVAGNRTPVLNISAAWLYTGMPVAMAFAIIHVTRLWLDEGPAGAFRSVIETGDTERDRT